MRHIPLLFAALFGLIATAQAELVVIAHPEGPVELSQNELRDLYLGRSDHWQVLELADGHPLRQAFHQQVTRRNEAQLRAHWSRLVFTGRGTPPRQLNDPQAILGEVARAPNVIGYVEADAVTDEVRIIFRP